MSGKVHKTGGGDRETIEAGGVLTIKAGGALRAEAGALVEVPAQFKVVSGASYVLSASDVGLTLRTISGSAVTVTVTTDFTRNVPVGSEVEVLQYGAGQVTFVATGVTIDSPETLKIAKQKARAILTLTDVQDVLSLAGYLEAA
jgi:hypothetical protein